MTRINTKSHNTARLSLGRLIRAYQAGGMESQMFRDLVYSMNTLLAYFKHDADLEIEKRLEAIEDSLKDGQR